VLKEIPDKGTVLSLELVDDKVWVGSSDYAVRIYDTASFHCLRETGMLCSFMCAVWLSSCVCVRNCLLTASLHHTTAHTPTHHTDTVTVVHDGPVTCMQRVGGFVFTASGDASVRVWEAQVRCLCCVLCRVPFMCCAVWLCCVIQFAVTCDSPLHSHHTRVSITQTGQCLHVLRGHTNWVTAMALVGGDVWTGSSDGKILAWNSDVRALCLCMLACVPIMFPCSAVSVCCMDCMSVMTHCLYVTVYMYM